MLQKYIILLEKYLNNQLSYEEQINFEYAIVNNVNLCEKLKATSTISENTFIKMYSAIKGKVKYRFQEAI